MESVKHSGRALKRKALDLLGQDDFDQALDELCRPPGRRVINPLFSFLCHTDQKIKWRAVTAMGLLGANTSRAKIKGLLGDNAAVEIYLNRKLIVRQVKDLAEEALEELS